MIQWDGLTLSQRCHSVLRKTDLDIRFTSIDPRRLSGIFTMCSWKYGTSVKKPRVMVAPKGDRLGLPYLILRSSSIDTSPPPHGAKPPHFRARSHGKRNPNEAKFDLT
jgi:hypothetical protein